MADGQQPGGRLPSGRVLWSIAQRDRGPEVASTGFRVRAKLRGGVPQHRHDRGRSGVQGRVCRALWSAGAISYRRAFTTGKAHLVPQKSRLKVPDHWKDLLTPEQWQAHEEILEVADRHIPHRVGKHENINVIALLMPPPQPRGVAGVAAISIRLASPGDDRVKQLIELCNVLIDIVIKRDEELSNKLMDEVKTKSLDELYRAADG